MQLMNIITSARANRLSFYFDIPDEFCPNKEEDKVDIGCTPDVKYDLEFYQKWVVILSNQKRFVSDSYDGNHVVKETSF